MLVNLSEKTLAFLREAAASWAEVKACMRLLRSIRGSGAARVTTSASGIVIHVDAPSSSPAETGGYRYAPFLILSSVSVGANKWEYEVAPTQGGGSNYTGRGAIPNITYKARNSWEESPDLKARYQNENVTGILPIPDQSPIDAYWSTRNGDEPVLIFKERNEAVCE